MSTWPGRGASGGLAGARNLKIRSDPTHPPIHRPQGRTTKQGEIQAIPSTPMRHRRPNNVRKGVPPPARPHAIPTISTAQPSTEHRIGHVPEITGHVRRNTHYLVENAAKYARSNTQFAITVSQDSAGLVDIRFSMESLLIKPEEQELIFEEGYSGSNAVDAGLSGAGLGLYLARTMARINSGNLNVIAGRSAGGLYFSRNTFILTLQGK